MNQAIMPTPADTYGEIDPPGLWTGKGIPRDFFADLNVRKMFAYCINATFYIDNLCLGRAYEPVTCAPDGFPYINTSQPVYNIDLTEAASYMAAANNDSGGALFKFGFTLDLIYDNATYETDGQMMINLASVIRSLDSDKFNVAAVGVPLSTELAAMDSNELPAFMMGSLADYSDLQDFMFRYMDSVGEYAMHTGYSNPTVDALLQQTAYNFNNPTILAADYGELEQIYYDDVPSVTLIVPIGTGFERDWVQGHYYNPLTTEEAADTTCDPGIYAYNLWKYNAIPGDIARLGSVNMADVINTLKAFGSYDGQFGAGGGYWPIMQARWNYYCDVLGSGGKEEWTQRTINMGTMVTILTHFGQVDTPTGTAGGAPYWNGAWNETSGWYG
jgi:hypothetical protein